MLAYKDDVIGQNTKGIEFLFKKNKIDWLKGWGSIPAAGKVTVGDETHEAKNIIIATGSEASSLPGVEVDEKVVVTSTGALTLGKIPKKMVVIGAGVIGLEMGSVYARLGTEVHVIEFLDHITPGHGCRGLEDLPENPEKAGHDFHTGCCCPESRGNENQGQGDLQTAQKGHRGNRSMQMSFWSPPAGNLSATGLASRRLASR